MELTSFVIRAFRDTAGKIVGIKAVELSAAGRSAAFRSVENAELEGSMQQAEQCFACFIFCLRGLVPDRCLDAHSNSNAVAV